MIIKVCGLTREEDVRDASRLGATHVGFVFAARSPRRVTPGQAAKLAVPKGVSRVGVFVDEDPERIGETMEACGLDFVQLHGAETPEDCARFPRERVIKAFRVGPGRPLPLSDYAGAADLFLLDTYRTGTRGGTGETFAWDDVREATSAYRIIVSGGISPGNVEEAVASLRPEGTDASSKLESAPGVKDHDKMADYIERARRALHAARQ